ncbi:MAG TPA: MotA/TolQ/ExbB proton channel family protein [Cellvibrio sp.]|nr:MotA/TolQ/ExbB proton channel family protein [Cellvibrio sp.]
MNELYQHIVEWTLWSLAIFSVVTWTLIFIKAVQHALLGIQNRRFKKDFWSAADLNAAGSLEKYVGPTARVAAIGFTTLRSADSTPASNLENSWDRQDLLERHLRQQIQKERRSLESGLAVLASIGSTAPFVGLFGTVFGIILALTAISSKSSANIEVVAGPIGEALVATGVGIAVAVPSVLAYNFFLRRLKLIAADLDDFATDFITLVQKSGFRVHSIPNVKSTSRSKDFSAAKTNTDASNEVLA